MPRSKSRALAKKAHAVRLFTKGCTYQQIADRVGYANRGTVHRIVTTAFNEQIADDIEVYRRIEYEALNRVLRSCWEIVESDAPVGQKIKALALAGETVMKKAKLLGLDCHRCREADRLTMVIREATQERQH